jgi:hypothetical protein
MTVNTQNKVQAKGCFQLIDLLIFMFGSFIMFGKTANLLGKFAPDDWFGLSPSDYGMAAALLIEGVLVVQKIKAWIDPPDNLVEWAMDFLATITPFLMSAFAQAADAWFTTGLIQGMSQDDKMKYTNFISVMIAIPILIMIIQTTIRTAPAGIFDNLKTGTANPFSWVGGLFQRGRGDAANAAVLPDDQLELPPQEVVNNGKVKTKTNPTRGQS